ncbi:MAG TPA: hypothetical protein VHY20_03750 [Pirellulales bacterium]|jgi:hypothetical protein|nr:hypothetical protein [Pirellulales bacterium]
MKRVFLCAAVLIALSGAGCRSAARQELLERDLRFQEDRINHLQGHLAEYRQQLDYALTENEVLQREILRLKGNPSGMSEAPAARPAAPFRAPQILPPGGQEPEGQLPRIEFAPQGGPMNLPVGPPKVELPPGASSDIRQPPLEQQAQLPITRLTLNRQLTGGYDNDQQPGDDGVMICLEPRAADGQIVDLRGPLSIVVMDPALDGEAARFARWDLAESDVAAHSQRSPQGAGLQLELPWPGGLPAHRQLKLFVRHATADGRRLDVDQEIEVIRPGEHVRRWTPLARQRRVRTVPIADPAPPPRELAEPAPLAAPGGPPAAESDLPATATARRPQWTPYR